MKAWFDECLTPTLVGQATRRGLEATCNRDRGLLGIRDENLHPIVVEEDWVFFTNNESDFEYLCQVADLHTGLVVLPQPGSRDAQWPLFHAAVDHIERHAEAAGESATDWMVNKRVDVDHHGTVDHRDLPA